MNRNQKPVTWPFVLVLAALFALSVTAPRNWQRPPSSQRANEAADDVTDARVPGIVVTAEPNEGSAGVANTDTGFKDVEVYLRPRIAEPELAAEHVTVDPQPVTTPGTALFEADESDDQPSEPSEVPTLSLENDATAATSSAPNPPELQTVQPKEDSTPVAPIAKPDTERVAARPSPIKQRRLILPRHATQTTKPQPAGFWGRPEALIDQLDRLGAECDGGEWATRVGDLVRQLCRADDPRSPRTLLALKRMRDLVDANHPLLVIAEHTPKKGELRRLRYAVLRRLDLWELVPDLTDASPDLRPNKQTVSLSGRPHSASLDSEKLTKLLGDLERYEQTGLSDDGRDLVADVRGIASSDEQLTARTGQWLEWNYRNANLRFVVSNELLNRLVPQQKPVEEPVHDRILGVPTRGWSTSTARVAIRLIPNSQAVHFALEAKGVVLARTTSRRDPVTLYSNSDSAYLARKKLQLTAEGLKAWPTEAEVSNTSRLRGIETDFDDVPILGTIVEGIARAKHAESEPAVRRVARRKVASRVQEEIDSAIEPKLKQARQLYQERVLKPLDGLALVPSVIDLQTTEARLTSRLRLAGEEQLAASTPRPMALGDSLASVQIHQSLFNNICDRLDVDGRTFTLPELQQRLMEAFQLPQESFPEEYPADLRITFAKRDAVTARFDEGRIELTLGIAELRRYPKTWRDFQVRVYYRPRVSGLDVRFARDGTVQLRSEHFGREPQIALRGIFSKVFSHDRELTFINPRMISDPRLAGLSVTQCVLTDGWIGLSLGRGTPAQARRRVSPLY